MTRKITIDSDTSISYIYKDKLFEVENKGTVTQRKATGTTEAEIRESAQNAFNVLQIVTEQQTPIDNTGKVVNVDRLVKLTRTDELLNKLSYTYDNTGTYIKTIQFNDYIEYPLVLEAEKGKLYIMNTDFIYDLSLNISSDRYVADICNFYYGQLGLKLDNKDTGYLYPSVIYDLITSYYNPNTRYTNTVNTRLQKDTQNNTLKYTNTIYSSNYKGEFPLSYTLTLNPNNKLVPDTAHEAHIIQLQENVITLTDTVPTYIHIGDVLQLTNVITTVNGTEYSADGNYTVTDIEDNTITVDRNFSTPYIYEPPTLNICGYKTNIQEISREDNTITLTGNVPDMYLIGDTITVEGTKTTINGQDYSLDGEYTIQDVQGHKIIVEEQPLTNYPYGETEAPSTPYVYKTIQAGLIQDITNNVITLEANPIQTLTNPSPVYVRYQDSHVEYATVTNIDENIVTVTPVIVTPEKETLTNFKTNIGKLQVLNPSEEVLISIQDSTNTIMPNTEFIVDTHDQATQYIGLLKNLVKPPVVCYNISNKYVPKYLKDKTGTGEGNEIRINGIPLECLGLYTDIYS